ncbi:MAG: heme o synthase [Vicinamibacterales bacterium]
MRPTGSANAAGLSTDTQRSLSISDYVALTKPRLNLLVVATSAAGYYLGATRPVLPLEMAEAVIGTALVASGAAVLNQVYERDTDRLMRRTRTRPLPDGRVSPPDAYRFGLVLSGAGLLLLAVSTNVVATLLALTTIVVYLTVYTPMKRRSSLSTLVGAIPGALPPLIGWAAASGTLSMGGWALFGIVFLWQIPHFMAIAWMYRDDYKNAGFPMLPVVEPDGRRAGQQALLYSIALIPMSLLPAYIGVSGWFYFWVALAFGFALLGLAARFAMKRSDRAARWLFFGSITYLPLLWASMIIDHSAFK